MPDETLLPNKAAEFIKHKLAHLECLAWQPVVREGDGDLKASKFAGKPWLSAGESYPTCPNCQNPMEFILQLNLEEFPEAVNERFGKGLFQSGYPHWQQGTEDCPNCLICGARMNQLIAQLESNDNIPVHWGDVGSGYIVQCPKHHEQVAFFWQCG